ncbi:LysR family transcriptional regulator [Sinorhizobium numidicum]|uniref:LysR family transcriptional regulator n=1 Tax=Sinorhizobium numidicum TaxID=680248 RepID=A0ABY8D0D3_9HYPH|nr:LysR family transcriptional regulator [Sinorhizobium numidicum]WEX77686.1 LysR family transcriptional regulator [Sinorhizobium numidicum]WEX84346.1 LysR family transcriptional regulator [Sinorhizobium numidicum]
MDRLTSMAVFVKAVDLGSFAAAANALGLSGPMVGKHVRFLEERLGVRLINRTTRRQSLTDFGRTYYERCRLVVAEAEAADALVTGQLSEPRGRLRITMPALLGRHCVAPILLELAQQYPRLELDLSFSDRLVDLVEDGYDLAIRTGNLEDRAGVIARRIARHRMVVCASPSYLETHGRPVAVEDLSGHDAIIYNRPGWVHPWLFPRDDQPTAEVTPTVRLRLDDLDAIADAAAAGLGLAWLPSWLVRERIRVGALIALLPNEPGYVFDNHALWVKTPHLPLKVRVAVDALAAALPKFMM